MTQREFILEIRRGLLTIMRAMVHYYGLAWLDFLPREAQPQPEPAPKLAIALMVETE